MKIPKSSRKLWFCLCLESKIILKISKIFRRASKTFFYWKLQNHHLNHNKHCDYKSFWTFMNNKLCNTFSRQISLCELWSVGFLDSFLLFTISARDNKQILCCFFYSLLVLQLDFDEARREIWIKKSLNAVKDQDRMNLERINFELLC